MPHGVLRLCGAKETNANLSNPHYLNSCIDEGPNRNSSPIANKSIRRGRAEGGLAKNRPALPVWKSRSRSLIAGPKSWSSHTPIAEAICVRNPSVHHPLCCALDVEHW